MLLKSNPVQNAMPVADLSIPVIMPMIPFSIISFQKSYNPGRLTCKCRLITWMVRLMMKCMFRDPMCRAKCSTKESVVLIVTTPIPLNYTPTPISFVPVVMFLMKIILLDLIPRTIIFINQAHKEPNVSNVICPTRHTWGLMIDGIIAYEYPGLIIP